MRFLVLEHIAAEHPAYFRRLWRNAGILWDTVALHAGDQVPPDASGYDALIAMGGPMDVWQTAEYPWLTPEIEMIRDAVVRSDVPFLGVCLGHQLLAAALGAEVRPAAVAEVGMGFVELTVQAKSDPLLSGLASPLRCFQWHGAEVAELPSGATLLASNCGCGIQAFRWGRYAYGMQFHAEIETDTVDAWRQIPEYAASLNASLGKEGAQELATTVNDAMPDLHDIATHLTSAFIRLVRFRSVARAGSAAR